jgi:hypothetical protein
MEHRDMKQAASRGLTEPGSRLLAGRSKACVDLIRLSQAACGTTGRLARRHQFSQARLSV